MKRIKKSERTGENYIYITQEINSDSTIVLHNGLPKFGIGETNSPERRFGEHTRRGSKSTVGNEQGRNIRTDLRDRAIHRRLQNLGYIKLKRKSKYENQDVSTKTEVFTGKSNKTIPNVVKKGDVLSYELLEKIIEIDDHEVFKNKLVSKPHQIDAYNFIIDRFNSGAKFVLLNHKPRSGKSYITYKLLIEGPYNIRFVLLLTQYPVLNRQWKRELENLRGHNFNIINFSNLEKDENGDIKDIFIDPFNPNLIMISLQDAKGNDDKYKEIYEFLDKQKFNIIKDINFDLIIFDEIHKGKETEQTDFLLKNLKFLKLLGLSATPTKNILRGTFEKENIHTYDLIKENEYKKKYGIKIYDLPDIRFNLLELDDIKADLKYFKEEEYFTFTKFFRVDIVYGIEQLHYYDDIQLFFKWIFGVGQFVDNALDGIIGRADIENILIFVENNNALKLLKECLENLGKQRAGRKFSNYNIYYTNSLVNNSNGLLELIDEIDVTPGKSIIFANKQLTTGVTLRKCDIVMLMNDWKSMDDYMQASYRCQSPSTTKRKIRTNVFDFNPSRSFNIFYEYIKYSTISNNGNFNKAVRDFLKCSNINIYDNGKFNEIDFDVFNSKILENIYTNYNKFDRIINNSINVSDLSESLKNDILKFGNFLNNKNKIESVKLNKDSIDSGKNKKVNKLDTNNTDEESEEKLNDADSIILSNIVLILRKTPVMSLLLNFNYSDINSIIDKIDNNEELKEIYINSLLLQTDIDFNTIYNIIKEIYKNITFKDELNDFLVSFNKKYDDILNLYLKDNDIVAYIEKVLELIGSYIVISVSEKKLLGEVFTPSDLINEMLDKLPKEVWSDPNLKWLDPANGIGNFPIAILKRLMEGLIEYESDAYKRYTHIMKKMIYICDINPKNMFVYNNLFNPNKYDNLLNIYRGSFLDDKFDIHMKSIWNVEKFDIIVGNPPYHESHLSGKSKTGGSNLYTKFIRKSYNILNTYLLFITPPTWMNTGSDEIDIFSKNQLLYINLEECSKYFKGVGSKFVYYLLEKKETYKDTFVICKFGNENYTSYIKLKDFLYLPMLLNNNVINIHNKIVKNEKFNFIVNFKFDHRNKYISESMNEEFKYELQHTSKQNRYSSIIHPNQFDKKVIISRSGNLSPFYDNGKIGTTDGCMLCTVDSELEGINLIKYLNSKLIRLILTTYKWNGFNDVTIIKNLPKINLSISWSDDDLYNYFNLTQDEIDFIEKTIE